MTPTPLTPVKELQSLENMLPKVRIEEDWRHYQSIGYRLIYLGRMLELDEQRAEKEAKI